MRVRFAVALISVVASLAIASCSEGGNGTGTAPPAPKPCPTTIPANGDDCAALQVCDYAAASKVAICPSAGGRWEIHERGEAGVFADAEIPEVMVDTGADGGDAADADAASTDGVTDSGDDTLLDIGIDAPLDVLVEDAASDG